MSHEEARRIMEDTPTDKQVNDFLREEHESGWQDDTLTRLNNLLDGDLSFLSRGAEDE